MVAGFSFGQAEVLCHCDLSFLCSYAVIFPPTELPIGPLPSSSTPSHHRTRYLPPCAQSPRPTTTAATPRASDRIEGKILVGADSALFLPRPADRALLLLLSHFHAMITEIRYLSPRRFFVLLPQFPADGSLLKSLRPPLRLKKVSFR